MDTLSDYVSVAGHRLKSTLKISLLPVVLLFLNAASVSQAVPASRDIVLVLDNSGSMKTNDPGRLTRVAVGEFLAGPV